MKDFWTEFRHVGNTTAARRGWQHAAEFLLCANPDHGQTLGELQRSTPWVWLWCERCQHHAPLACAVAVIRRGPGASSDKLPAGARCTRCGRKGATLEHPGWAGNHIGFYPFPAEIADSIREQCESLTATYD